MKILIADIETTGFLKGGGKIVEVGLVELDLFTGETVVLFDSLVQEKKMTPEDLEKAWIFDNSDMKREDVLNAPFLEDLLPEIQEILNKYYATAFNKSFDFGYFKNRGLIIKELDCLMLLSTNICKIPKKSGHKGYKWPNAEEAYKFFFGKDCDYVEKHRGADDSIHEAGIAFELFKMGVLRVPNEMIIDHVLNSEKIKNPDYSAENSELLLNRLQQIVFLLQNRIPSTLTAFQTQLLNLKTPNKREVDGEFTSVFIGNKDRGLYNYTFKNEFLDSIRWKGQMLVSLDRSDKFHFRNFI